MVDQIIKLRSEDSYELDDIYDLVTAALSLNWKGHQGPEVGLLFHLGVWCELCGLCGLCSCVVDDGASGCTHHILSSFSCSNK